MEPLQTWWTTELYPTSDEDNFGVVGNFEVVKAADAQATIAALQARVQELEDDRSAWKEIAQDWSAAAKLAEQPEKFYDGYSAAVMNAMQALLTKARADLARVTAELEEANHSAQTFQTLWRESCNQRDDLQAELERVRGLVKTYADAKIDFDDKRLQEDHHAWRERYNKLVEAENALLQHRQGMEG